MNRLKKPISFETTFGTYVVDEQLGEGGAGRVYGGVDGESAPIAVKVLVEDRATTDKRRRFRNEIAFLQRNKHRNIVTVLDHGVARVGAAVGPFYIMRRYDTSLRDLMRGGIAPNDALAIFSQMLDGVEAAHLQGVVHRDLKPENVLYDRGSNTFAIADFGTARFTEDLLVTTVETAPAQRLANFQYAAPEQRVSGQTVGVPADIYALGLMLNELFTTAVPAGTEYRQIGHVAKEHDFLDAIVARMIRQAPGDRPATVADVKGLIQHQRSEAVTLQRLSKIADTVVGVAEIDEPLALTPPKLIDFDWDRGYLTLTLDRAVTPEWIEALQQLGHLTYVVGKDPRAFTFRGNQAFVGAAEHEVQSVIDNFKTWLPGATTNLKNRLEAATRKREADERNELRREREEEERRLRVKRSIKL
jgi:serine/threonine protein kinase